MNQPHRLGATPAKRLAAGLIDVALLLVATAIVVGAFGKPKETAGDGLRLTVNDEALVGGAAMTWLAAMFAYFFVTEVTLGRTVGKIALGLRVVDLDGHHPSAGAVLGRTLLRPVDGFPYVLPNLLGFIVLASTARRQRVGEIVSNTLVIDERGAQPPAA